MYAHYINKQEQINLQHKMKHYMCETFILRVRFVYV